MSITEAFNENYIICGRGARNYNNQGNVRFRQLVETNLPLYLKCGSSRKAKSEILDSILRNIINEGMSFVAYTSNKESSSACWRELSEAESRNEVAHRFRDSAQDYARQSKPSPPQLNDLPMSEAPGKDDLNKVAHFSLSETFMASFEPLPVTSPDLCSPCDLIEDISENDLALFFL